MADTLIILTIGLPLSGALVTWLAGARRSLAPVTLVIACLGATGVSALLVLFLPLGCIARSVSWFSAVTACFSQVTWSKLFMETPRRTENGTAMIYRGNTAIMIEPILGVLRIIRETPQHCFA
jgi:hypothetical protein